MITWPCFICGYVLLSASSSHYIQHSDGNSNNHTRILLPCPCFVALLVFKVRVSTKYGYLQLEPKLTFVFSFLIKTSLCKKEKGQSAFDLCTNCINALFGVFTHLLHFKSGVLPPENTSEQLSSRAPELYLIPHYYVAFSYLLTLSYFCIF